MLYVKNVINYISVKLIRCYFDLRLFGLETNVGRKRPRSTSDFKRMSYWLDSNLNLVLIHYVGNENLYQPMPHGNSKRDTEFVRTMPSVIDTIKEKRVNLDNNEVIVNQQPVIENPTSNPDCSQQSFARFNVDNNLITLVPQQGAFIVNGRKGKYLFLFFQMKHVSVNHQPLVFIFWLQK
ncbi:unnamed protein product [Mytilus coruscus]|uniref:Uncharacterized protein n=1 Tax=Mytilus coruscus TaxID=42192 RepID=A0A6J8BMU8_MYTCO|nr:unnamed protein product [Mytilus coruscus]